MINQEKLTGVWSAAPTPLADKMEVDVQSVKRMAEHQLRLGINLYLETIEKSPLPIKLS